MTEPVACPHTERKDGICVACGDCLHELVLNAACYYCGRTDLDPIALSNKPVSAAALVHIRKK